MQPCIELAFKFLSFFTHPNPQRRGMENNNIHLYGFAEEESDFWSEEEKKIESSKKSWVRDETMSSVRGLGSTSSYLLQVFVAERLAYWDAQWKSIWTLGLRVWMEVRV